LDEAAVGNAVAAALSAISAAPDLDALKDVRLAHAGDKGPLALANRSIGGLPGAEKALAGKLVGPARGKINQALAARQVELEAERAARVLVTEAVDVTVPVTRVPAGARHPLELVSEQVADFFVSMGWDIAEGPELEAEWFN